MTLQEAYNKARKELGFLPCGEAWDKLYDRDEEVPDEFVEMLCMPVTEHEYFLMGGKSSIDFLDKLWKTE
jgi:hypothetical protein